LCDWGWCGLDTLPRGYSYTTSDNRGGGDAEPCTRDEIASGDDRSRVLVRCVRAHRLGRLVAR
jgi:hypothetical protein